MKLKHVLVALSTAVAMAGPVSAQNLAEDFANALRFDPSYQAALAERNAGIDWISTTRSSISSSGWPAFIWRLRRHRAAP